jgi:hypothetical protein
MDASQVFKEIANELHEQLNQNSGTKISYNEEECSVRFKVGEVQFTMSHNIENGSDIIFLRCIFGKIDYSEGSKLLQELLQHNFGRGHQDGLLGVDDSHSNVICACTWERSAKTIEDLLMRLYKIAFEAMCWRSAHR